MGPEKYLALTMSALVKDKQLRSDTSKFIDLKIYKKMSEDKEVNSSPVKDSLTIAWFAGFYEGEGYISNDISNGNRLRLGIDQNDDTPLQLAKELWGGSVRSRTRVSDKGKVCHGNTWRLCHNEAMKFIEDIRPYMKIPYKIKQIEECLEKSTIKSTRRFSCNFCENDFASPSGRRRHEKNFHSDQLKG